MLLAAVAPSPEAARGLATLLVITMSACGGAWFPVSFMPEFMQHVSTVHARLLVDGGLRRGALGQCQPSSQLLPTLGILLAHRQRSRWRWRCGVSTAARSSRPAAFGSIRRRRRQGRMVRCGPRDLFDCAGGLIAAAGSRACGSSSMARRTSSSTPLAAFLNSLMALPTPRASSGILSAPNRSKKRKRMSITSGPPMPSMKAW